MNKDMLSIVEYLETCYSGAKMSDDVEGMCRISRAIAALQADTEMEIFTEEFQMAYVMREL